MEMLERKDLEVSEKNATIKSYLDKIVNLTETAASKDARLGELESELGRLHATSARFLQEKELLERHNTWLNEELTAKVDSLIQIRKANGALEAEMSSKLAQVEKKFKESSSSLNFYKDRVRELEEKLASERELLSTMDAAAAAEGRFSAKISTINACNGFSCDDFSPNKPYKSTIWFEAWSGWFTEFGGPIDERPDQDLAIVVYRFIHIQCILGILV